MGHPSLAAATVNAGGSTIVRFTFRTRRFYPFSASQPFLKMMKTTPNNIKNIMKTR